MLASIAGVASVITPSNTNKNAALAAELNSQLFRFVHVPTGVPTGVPDAEVGELAELLWEEAKAARLFAREHTGPNTVFLYVHSLTLLVS